MDPLPDEREKIADCEVEHSMKEESSEDEEKTQRLLIGRGKTIVFFGLVLKKEIKTFPFFCSDRRALQAHAFSYGRYSPPSRYGHQ